MRRLAIIGGSGLAHIPELQAISEEELDTPYGKPSADLIVGALNGIEVTFLARHGGSHTIPPHKINYRANIWALHHLGVESIAAVAAVGGITRLMEPGVLVIPDQIIDYTYGRKSTFFEDDSDPVTHIDFTYPYSEKVRHQLIQASEQAGLAAVKQGTYGCTQGPRLETAAEIRRMAHDGCDLVGMTGMPEAALARELSMEYACCAVVVNWAAGKTEGIISMVEIEQNLQKGMADVLKLLREWLLSRAALKQ